MKNEEFFIFHDCKKTYKTSVQTVWGRIIVSRKQTFREFIMMINDSYVIIGHIRGAFLWLRKSL